MLNIVKQGGVSMSSRKDRDRIASAAFRRKDYQEKTIGEGNVKRALGLPDRSPSKQPDVLIPTKRIDGNRVWTFD